MRRGQARFAAETIATRLSEIDDVFIWAYPKNVDLDVYVAQGTLVLSEVTLPTRQGQGRRRQGIKWVLEIVTGSDATGDAGESAEHLLGDLVSANDDGDDEIDMERSLLGKLHNWPAEERTFDVYRDTRADVPERERDVYVRSDSTDTPDSTIYGDMPLYSFTMEPRIENFNIDRRVNANQELWTVLAADITAML